MKSISFVHFLLFCVFGVCHLGRHEANAICTKGTKERKFIKVSQEGLAPVKHFKTTTVTSPTLCSFDCADQHFCWSFVFLTQKTSDNCLLSQDTNGGSSDEDSETYKRDEVIQNNQTFYDQVCNHDKCQRGSKCVACSLLHYECGCPAWASGRHCENLESEYDHSLIPWKRGKGDSFVSVDSSYDTWGITSNEMIWMLQPNGTWQRVEGWLKQISVEENRVWAVNIYSQIFARIGVTSSNPVGTHWWKDRGSLTQISAGSGVNWGVNPFNKIWYRSGVWVHLSNGFKWVSCGKFGCWAVKTDGTALFRTGVTADNPGGMAWVDTEGSFKQLDCGPRGEVYAVDDAGQVYTREGISESRPEGEKWSQFGNHLLAHVSAGDKFVCGLTADGSFYTLP